MAIENGHDEPAHERAAERRRCAARVTDAQAEHVHAGRPAGAVPEEDEVESRRAASRPAPSSPPTIQSRCEVEQVGDSARPAR